MQISYYGCVKISQESLLRRKKAGLNVPKLEGELAEELKSKLFPAEKKGGNSGAEDITQTQQERMR